MSPRPYRSPVRHARTQKTRVRIVDAALAILSSEDGLGGLSVEAVAERAGVARMTVYYQYGSRRGLLEAAFDELAVRGGLGNLPETFRIDDPPAALRAFVSVFCRFWGSGLAPLRRLNAAAGIAPEIGDSIRERNEMRRRGLAVLVGRMHDVADEPALVDALFMLTSVATYDSLAGPERGGAAVEDLVQTLVDAVVERFRQA